MLALEHAHEALEGLTAPQVRGVVRQVRGLAVSVSSLPVPVGAQVIVRTSTAAVRGEVVGLDGPDAVVMLLGTAQGVARGDAVELDELQASVPVGDALMGRVVNALGEPIDDKGPLKSLGQRPLNSPPVPPMDRPLIDQP
ncbi:MAG: EscN/YscN/HrcN family type III secretion system ATPase, partial [Algisphaera sp.]